MTAPRRRIWNVEIWLNGKWFLLGGVLAAGPVRAEIRARAKWKLGRKTRLRVVRRAAR